MEFVYKLLEKESETLLEKITACVDIEEKAELIGNKNLLEHSIRLLKKCDEFDICAGSVFTKLPQKMCNSPSSEYRIVEDGETEDKKYWEEVQVNGKQFNCVRLSEGDVVIEL